MLLGDKKGFNRIYNKAGQPLLRTEEQLEYEAEGTWKGYYIKKGFKYVNQYKTYRGRFYVTDYRLLFIGKRKKLGQRAVLAVSGVGKVTNVGKFQAAREKLSDYRDFFELKYFEIKKIQSTPIAVRITGKDAANKYRVETTKKIEDPLQREYSAWKKRSK